MRLRARYAPLCGGAETVYAVTHRVLPPWELEVHPELRRITEKAMHWERAERYASSPGRAVGMAEVSQCMHTCSVHASST